MIDIDTIDVGPRRRQLDDERLIPLMESIRDVGLLTPITVCFDSPAGDGVPRLVAGLHRLRACRQLGLGHIAAFVVTFDSMQRELWEIDENLMRTELSELEQAEHHKRRKELLEAKGAARLHGGARSGGAQIAHLKSYADQAAGQLRQHPSTVRRAVRRAERIDPSVVAAIKDTPFADKGVELDALASMSAAQQRAALRLVQRGKVPDFRAARQILTDAADAETDADRRQKHNDRAFEAMKRSWLRADADVQKRFVCWLELEGHLARCRPQAKKPARGSG